MINGRRIYRLNGKGPRCSQYQRFIFKYFNLQANERLNLLRKREIVHAFVSCRSCRWRQISCRIQNYGVGRMLGISIHYLKNGVKYSRLADCLILSVRFFHQVTPSPSEQRSFQPGGTSKHLPNALKKMTRKGK